MVQQLLGHVNFRTTQRYSHLLPEALAKAVASLDAHLLGGAQHAAGTAGGMPVAAAIAAAG